MSESLLYRFEESGEGCGQHPDPDCLCDVQPLPGGVPIVKVPGSHHYPENGTSEALRFIVWASTTLGRFEALNGVDETALNEAKGIWDAANTGHHRIHAVSLCVSSGLTFEQTARWLEATVPQVMDVLYPDRERHALILALEPVIRRADKPAVEIAKQFGLKGNYVSMVAKRWGITLPHGGIRFPEKTEQARTWAKQGISHREIARRLDTSQSWVQRRCHDIPVARGRKPKVTK